MTHLRHALRSFAHQRGFTFLAVLAMAIGIGANTAVFSVVHAVLLKPLPYASPDELVFVTEVRQGTANSANVPPANYLDYTRARSFTAIGAAESWGATLTGFDVPERVPGLRLTASMFDVVGVKPALGHVFGQDEERPGAHRVVVLTHGYWMQRFGGDPGIIGRSIQLGGEPWQVVGVMPRDFQFAPFWATDARIYAPLSWTDAQRASRGGRTLRVFARLRGGLTAQASVHELASLFQANNENTGLQPAVTPLNEVVVGKVRKPLAVLLVAVSLVLLIACANVATLLLVRALGRRRELAVRISLGASRWDLLRSSFAESALLSFAGGGVGLLIASVGIDALAGWFRTAMPRHDEISISTPVLLFTMGLSFLTTLTLSLISTMQVPFNDLNAVLKESVRTAGGTTTSNRIRRGLVVAQVAMSLLLLVSAGLLTRSLLAIEAVDPGFDPSGVRTGVLHAWGTSVAPAAAQMAFYRAVDERLRAEGPAGLINHVPLTGDMWTLPVTVEGRAAAAPGEQLGAAYRVATPGYFEAMRIRATRGRLLNDADVPGAPKVVVVNEALARQVWPGEEAVGKRISVDGGDLMTVCGVVRDVVQRDWIAPRTPEVYLPLAQHPEAIGRGFNSSMTAVTRSPVDIRSVAALINNSVPVSDVQTMGESVATATQRSRVYAALLGVFASSAVLLALIGLYGVMSSDVSRRVKEIGVRAALGARPRDLWRMVLRDAMLLTAIGTAAGLAAAITVSHGLESMLYGVQPTDALTLIGAVCLFGSVGAVAASIPARRASRLDPVRAIRNE